MELKFRKYGSGICQKCYNSSDELFSAHLNSDGNTKTFILCKDCSLELKRSVDEKNAEISKSAIKEKRFCSNCGTELGDGEMFCGNCGAKAEEPIIHPAQNVPVRKPAPRQKVRSSNKKSNDIYSSSKKIDSKKIVLIVVSVLLFAGIVVGAVFGVKAYKKHRQKDDYKSNYQYNSDNFENYQKGVNDKKISEHRTIQFGSYPQSRVTDSSLISKLNSCSIYWNSLNYYAGDNECDGTMSSYDIAYYADVSYGGEKYRAVRLDEYRPSLTCAKRVGTVPNDETNQHRNNYFTGNVYWFKYEPITWTVLDESTGLAVTDMILDAQPFSNYIRKGSDDCYYGLTGEFSNNWEESYLRKWLNDDFYYIAFSGSEMERIKNTNVDNSYINGTDYGYNRSSTYDKVFILSYEDWTNTSYGFSSDSSDCDSARSALGTDYAKSQNLDIFRVESEEDEKYSQYVGYSYYGMRTVGKGTRNICYTDARGFIQNYDYVHDTSCGVRPAICIAN